MSGTAIAARHWIKACLITTTDTNPFFVRMKEGAEAKVAALSAASKSFAVRADGDRGTQVGAIETCIPDRAGGILLTASDTSSIVGAVFTVGVVSMIRLVLVLAFILKQTA